MRILVLTNRIPYPLNDGGNLAVHAMLQALNAQKDISLSLLSMNTTKHWVPNDSIPSFLKELEYFSSIKVDNSTKAKDAFTSLLKGRSYNVERFISADYRIALKDLLSQNKFDIVLLEGLFLFPYIATIKENSRAKICYRQHNVEFEIWERLAQNAKNPIKAWYLNSLAKSLKQFELKHLNSPDGMAAISSVDANHYRKLGCSIPIADIPFSIPMESTNPREENMIPKSIYHIGAMDWAPNIEGVNWFLETAWPIVIKTHPEAKLYLAGRNMPEAFMQKSIPGVTILGEVASAAHFEADKQILIVPLKSGGGLRIKTLLAMAQGKAVVSTTVGMQGINEAIDGKDVLIANDPESFAKACISLLSNTAKTKALGKEAQSLIQSTYSQESITKRMTDFLKSI